MNQQQKLRAYTQRIISAEIVSRVLTMSNHGSQVSKYQLSPEFIEMKILSTRVFLILFILLCLLSMQVNVKI